MFSGLFRLARGAHSRAASHFAQKSLTKLRLEILEGRDMPAALTVNTLADTHNAMLGRDTNGNVSMRSAIEYENTQPGQNSINIGQGLAGTIWLTLNIELDVNANIAVTGPIWRSETINWSTSSCPSCGIVR